MGIEDLTHINKNLNNQNNYYSIISTLLHLLHILNSLLSAEKFVKSGCEVISDSPKVTVVNKKTNKMIFNAQFDKISSSWKIFPDEAMLYTFTLNNNKQPMSQARLIINLANNTYILTTKKKLLNSTTSQSDGR